MPPGDIVGGSSIWARSGLARGLIDPVVSGSLATGAVCSRRLVETRVAGYGDLVLDHAIAADAVFFRLCGTGHGKERSRAYCHGEQRSRRGRPRAAIPGADFEKS